MTDQPPASINGVPVPPGALDASSIFGHGSGLSEPGPQVSSLYLPNAFEEPYRFSLPYAFALGVSSLANPNLDPYASTVQSQNLRVIESTLNPRYQAKNDVIELGTPTIPSRRH